MFAVCVDITVHPDQMQAFLPLIVQNAEASLRDEPGCVQFDVVRPERDANLVVLYELYTDAAAFAAHLQTPHFKEFDAATAPLVQAKSLVTGPRVAPQSS